MSNTAKFFWAIIAISAFASAIGVVMALRDAESSRQALRTVQEGLKNRKAAEPDEGG